MSMEPISRSTRGAKFFEADLHLHSPASHDFQDEGDPDEYVDALVQAGLDMVAITDHDNGDWYERLREAAEGREMEILPGVEITTPGGGSHEVHLLGIFPPENSDAVTSVLGSQGLLTAAPGKGVSDDNIWAICDEINEHGGIPILAHIDQTCGALNENPRDTRTRRRIFDEEKVAALEAIEPDSIDEDLGDFPFIRSSDAHALDQIGSRTTFLKMSEPTFEGLKIALKDPESRISYDEPDYSHPSITGLRVSGDFFSDKELQINRNLNCLIGGKGTGKSCVVEHIRYALDIEPRSARIEEEYKEKIAATLGDGGIVEVHLRTEESDEYVVTRKFGEETAIHTIEGRAVALTIEEFKNEFFGLEIYSQRELLEIALDARSQLELLDSYFQIDEAKSERDSIKSDLRENGSNIQRLVSKGEELREKLTNIDVLRENIQRLEDRGVEEYVEGEENWDSEKSVLRRIEERLSNFHEVIENLDPVGELESPDVPQEQPNEELLDEALDEMADARNEASGSVDNLKESISNSIESVENIRERWDGRYQSRQAELEELSEEIEGEIGVDISDYFELKARERELQEVEESLSSIEDETEELESDREDLFDDLTEARRRITAKRREGSKNLNDNLDEVRLRINEGEDRSDYVTWLKDKLTGSNLQNDDRRLIAEEFDPRELSQIVREREYPRVEQAGLTETGAHNLIDHDPLRNDLHILELQEIRDEPVIQILEESGGWKPLNSMSDGQRCTSLLSIAMLERDVPLIIDQPEDMLDNEFIYSTVVQLLRDIKHERQIIAVTHNANIPVLGDAELIVELRSSGNRGHFTCRGSIDDPTITTRVQQVLEGGEQAFDMRSQKYGY